MSRLPLVKLDAIPENLRAASDELIAGQRRRRAHRHRWARSCSDWGTSTHDHPRKTHGAMRLALPRSVASHSFLSSSSTSSAGGTVQRRDVYSAWLALQRNAPTLRSGLTAGWRHD